MLKRPKTVFVIVLLWLALSAIFVMWGWFSLTIVLQLPSWKQWLEDLLPQVNFGYLVSTIVWFVFSSLFIVFAYGTFRKDNWVWTTSIIISSIFLAVFGLMLAAFMINALFFLDPFSVWGLVTAILSFLIDIGIVFFLTRPATKIFFEVGE